MLGKLGLVVTVALAVAVAGCTAPDSGGRTNQTGGNQTNPPPGNTNDPLVNVSGPGGNVSAGQATVVSMMDNVYQPEDIRVSAGGVVRFRNDGMANHTVTLQREGGVTQFYDRDVGPGESTDVPFPEPGLYKLRCTLHSSDYENGMVGTVTVS